MLCFIREGVDYIKLGGFWAFDSRRLEELFNEPPEIVDEREKELKNVSNIKEYNQPQRLRIKYALQEGVDITSILNKEYNKEQMLEILEGILDNGNYNLQSNPKLSDKHMHYLRIADSEGFDVAKINNLDIGIEYLWKVRIRCCYLRGSLKNMNIVK